MDWLPIETAPMDGTRVLVWCGGRGQFDVFAATRYAHDEHWMTDDCDPLYYPEPTHWMPLPAPPTPSPR